MGTRVKLIKLNLKDKPIKMCLFLKNKLQNMEEEFLTKLINQDDDFDDTLRNDDDEELEEEKEDADDDEEKSDEEEIETE
ncbi:MAG: hypothetical protein AAB957_01440 [Patescibacteria group bacterium]